MTDQELLATVIGILDPGRKRLHGLKRGDHLLLSLPAGAEAASVALRLYQPQRKLARGVAFILRTTARLGLHRIFLPPELVSSSLVCTTPALGGIEADSCGVMLGSPEHRVRRAIASYRISGEWEVAKISFEAAGRANLEREARVLVAVHDQAVGAPALLGLHRAGEATILRMPFLTGRPIPQGAPDNAVALLSRWITSQEPRSIDGFPEWPAIQAILSTSETGAQVLKNLSRENLRPVIRHGDFARWNLLRRADGGLMAIDWEWGHEEGMPGLDLVHYFLQDARLVRRLSPARAIAATIEDLGRASCSSYLAKTGWSGDPLLPIIACLAYKQGAGHQENRDVLHAAVGRMHSAMKSGAAPK